MVLTALSGGKLSKLILKFNFLLISRALARFDVETFQRRVNCYIVSKKNDLSVGALGHLKQFKRQVAIAVRILVEVVLVVFLGSVKILEWQQLHG